jgi:hypothetical protein
VVEEDLEEEVSHGAPSTSTLTSEKSELVLSLLSAIQSQDPMAMTHLQALMDVTSPPIPVLPVHPVAGVLTRWATSHGFIKPGNYKESCETGGISAGTYLFLDPETQMVTTVTYEPWDMLSRIITKMFLKFRCAVLTNTCMTAYRTTQLGVLLCGAKVREDTYACLLTRCNEFLRFAGESSSLITAVSIHEKIKRLIMTDLTISQDMRIFDHLLATSMDSLSMVKKADQLVIKHQQKMQTAESNLKSAQDLLTAKEWKTLLAGLEVPPSRAVSPASREEDDNTRAGCTTFIHYTNDTVGPSGPCSR